MNSMYGNNCSEVYGEADVRRDVAACYRLLSNFGLTDLTDGAVSARNPSKPGNFVLGSYGLLPKSARASQLLERTISGNYPYEGKGGADVDALFFIDAVTQQRDDVNCVIHAHTPATAYFTATNDEIKPISQAGLMFYNRIEYVDYEFDIRSPSNCKPIASAFAEGKQVLIRNHGAVVAGSSVAHAFLILFRLNQACEIQLQAMKSPAGLAEIDAAKALELSEMFWTDPRGLLDMNGEREWDSLLQSLEKTDPDYVT